MGTPFASAANYSTVNLAEVAKKAKNAADFVEGIKSGLTPEEFEFLLRKSKEAGNTKMPSLQEFKPGFWQIHASGITYVIKYKPGDDQSLTVNSKTLHFSGMDLNHRWALIQQVVQGKAPKSADVWKFFLPEANADFGAVIGIISGIVFLAAMLYDKNSANCDRVSTASSECATVEAGFEFYLADAREISKGEVATVMRSGKQNAPLEKTKAACDQLTKKGVDLAGIVTKAKSALGTILAYGCNTDFSSLGRCRLAVENSQKLMYEFREKVCEPVESNQLMPEAPATAQPSGHSAPDPDGAHALPEGQQDL